MRILIVLAPCLLASSAFAQRQFPPTGLTWTWAELGYSRADVDGGGDEHGYFLRGASQFDENLFLFGGIGHDTPFVGGPEGLDETAFEAGAGLRYPVLERTELFAGLSWLRADGEDGWGLRAGVRHRLNDDLELGAAFLRQDIERGESGFEFGGYWTVKPQVSLGLAAVHFDDVDALALSVRFDR